MTPLASIEGTPFAGGLIGGVQLEPAGTEFVRPAALVISGENVKEAAGQVAYGYDATGKNLHLTPWFQKTPDFVAGYYVPGRSIVLPVEHFSGLGVGPATDLETARQLRYDAGDARNRLTQNLAKELTKERDRQLKGEEPTDLSALTDATI